MSITPPNVPKFSLIMPNMAKQGIVNTFFTLLSFQSIVSTRWTQTASKDQGSPFYWANRAGQDGLSEHYMIEIEVQTQTFIEPSALLAEPAILQHDNVFFHGYLSSITCLPTAPSGHRYRLILSSPLYPLTQKSTPRVFIDKTVPQIIEACLSSYDWQQGSLADYHFDLQDDYPPLRCWIQYTENDFDHIQRLLRKHGLFFYFVQNAKRATLVFSDRLNNKTALTVSLNQTGGSLLSVQALGQVQPANSLFSDYNPSSPNTPWIANQRAKKISGSTAHYGTTHVHGAGADCPEQNAKFAKIRQESVDWQCAITLASTTLLGLRPGQSICITDHPILPLNQTYTIVDIEHYGSQSAAYLGKRREEQEASAPLSYSNRLVLIPQTLAFRKYDGYPPLIQGPLRCRLESSDNDISQGAIDETGDYRFRYPFDNTDKNPIGMASPKTRFTQMMGTAGEGLAGMHFPNRHGTEVEIVFLHGNINSPMIVGALSTPAVVNQNNHHQALVRTANGHEWCLDDTPDHESIHLSTPEKKEVLALKANLEDIGITLKTEQGGMKLKAAQDICWETAETLSIQATDYELITAQSYDLSVNARINWETGGNFFLKAEFMTLTGPELSVNSAQNIVMEAHTLHCTASETEKSTLTFSAQNALYLESHELQLRATDSITIENAGAKIVFENGNITLESPSEIELIGDSVQFLGAQQRE
jgi:Rhs element Vgr protein